MRFIKLMADYECFPLWEATPGTIGNINPDDLPLSPSLKLRLQAWANVYDSTLNRDNPLESGFDKATEATSFQEEGNLIARQLSEELGSKYSIIYRS